MSGSASPYPPDFPELLLQLGVLLDVQLEVSDDPALVPPEEMAEAFRINSTMAIISDIAKSGVEIGRREVATAVLVCSFPKLPRGPPVGADSIVPGAE